MQYSHGVKALTEQSPFTKYSPYPQNTRSDRFARLFPDLPPLYVDPAILRQIGRPGGSMEETDFTNTARTVDAGVVFFGQFIDHDITLDVQSSLSSVNDAETTNNSRTPTLDLDCIYGNGPEDSAYLYFHEEGSPFNGVTLLSGADAPNATAEQAGDLMRNYQGRAIIGDQRNDENRIVSQIQLGMIRFHNKVAQKLHSHDPELKGSELFEKTRQLTTWIYQWSILYDFLPTMCGTGVVKDILSSGRKYYCPDEAYIPVEFSVAAYRFGHSMVPHKLRVRDGGPNLNLFGPEFGKGFTPVSTTEAIVDFKEIFGGHQKAHKLDTKMAPILLALPFITSGEKSLVVRNLLRGQSFLLPSGENIARKLGLKDREIHDVSEKANSVAGYKLEDGTPLWLYILAKAETSGRDGNSSDKGEGLGPVGGRIVAETLIGLMELDPRSFLSSNRNWSPADAEPVLGKAVENLKDMLTF